MPHSTVEVLDGLIEDFLLAREVQVEGPRCDARRLDDLDDRRVVVAELSEHMLGRLDEACAGGGPALRRGPAFVAVALLAAGTLDAGAARRFGLGGRRAGAVACAH